MPTKSELAYATDLADGLRRARIAAGYGQRQAAREAGLVQSSLWRIEVGRIVPSQETLDVLLRLYRANLNIGPDGLMLTWMEDV